MPSEKALQAKQEAVAQLKSKLDGAVAGVLVDYRGITVADDTKLRRELREAGVDYSVVKNTLLRRALEGTEYSEMDSKGTFAIKSGFVEGKVLDVPGVTALAKLPSKEQLLVQLLSVLNGNIRGLAVALNAIVEKENEKESA